MITNVSSHFCFRPVGQGCFYVGNIHVSKDKNFKFVYDCGTNSNITYLKSEVDIYRNRLMNHLNMLVISHFDKDHVNGVVRLLKNVKCVRLVIPYYKTIERLLLYAITDSTDEDYRNLLLDPIAYFRNEQFNIDEIIVIGAGDQDSTIDVLEGVPPERPLLRNLELSEEDSKLFDLYDSTNYSRNGSQHNKDTNFTFSLNSQYTFIKTPYHQRLGPGLWEFVFYLREIENKILMNKFTSDVNILLKKHSINLFELFEKPYIGKLKAIYRRYYGKKLNDTSLVMYHGPYFQYANNVFMDSKKYLGFYSINYGTLLTGDIALNTENKIDRMRNYYGYIFDEIGLLQVPHHGSKYNWCFKHDNGLEEFFYVINHGLGGKHPYPEVINDITTNCIPDGLALNNEVNPFCYRIFCRS